MNGEDTAPERRRDSAVILARLLVQGVRAKFPRELRDDDHFDSNAIDEDRSASISEFYLVKWPRRHRLSIHSDDGDSLVGYGVFSPKQTSDHEGLSKYLLERVSNGRRTRKLWSWYRQMAEPLCDFSQIETLVEVEKISRRQPSEADAAFRQAVDDLAMLAAALDEWYFKGRPARG